ncbi:MAG: hypothetical protein WBC04_26415 [Candidatus Acidiferrales bacterium]
MDVHSKRYWSHVGTILAGDGLVGATLASPAAPAAKADYQECRMTLEGQ